MLRAVVTALACFNARRLTGIAVLWLLLPAGIANALPVELVFGYPENLTALRITAERHETIVPAERVPLGSLWKLFVYAYLVGAEQEAPDYACTGSVPTEEVYCCAPGEKVSANEALAKSCSLFFMPDRLGINAEKWRAYWQRESANAPEWLFRIKSMRPEQQVSVISLLAALASIEGQSKQATMSALQRVILEPRARALLSSTGSTLRVKTWSWFEESSAKGRANTRRRIGGFAGWLADGTPVWLKGSGTSASVIEGAANRLADHLPVASPVETACVKVRFFTRYPVSEVLLDTHPAPEGRLHGKVEVRFINGQKLFFTGVGDIGLDRSAPKPRLMGRFGLNDYIARVIEREASGEPVHAARALAVAARTYLIRHADFGSGCYEINDDSRAQRVSPHVPGQAARQAAEWTDGLILSNTAGRYHLEKEAKDQLAWKTAVAEAKQGMHWEEILQHAYENAGFGILGEDDVGECMALANAENWLKTQEKRWKNRLASMAGYERPSPLPQVCQLRHGNPYADIERNRIYATGVASPNERLTLTHEYLHFALAYHPRGRDEAFVEQTARLLLGLQ